MPEQKYIYIYLFSAAVLAGNERAVTVGEELAAPARKDFVSE